MSAAHQSIPFSLLPKWEGALDGVGIPVHLEEEDKRGGDNVFRRASSEGVCGVRRRRRARAATSLFFVCSSALLPSFLPSAARCACATSSLEAVSQSVTEGRAIFAVECNAEIAVVMFVGVRARITVFSGDNL